MHSFSLQKQPRTRTAQSIALPIRKQRSIGTVLGDESGAATAEYAIATMAAVAFAGMLVVIMRSDKIRDVLTGLVERALNVP